jgi:hypothetical protein
MRGGGRIESNFKGTETIGVDDELSGLTAVTHTLRSISKFALTSQDRYQNDRRFSKFLLRHKIPFYS